MEKMGNDPYRYRTGILIAIAAMALIGTLFLGPLPQDPAYHLFADTCEIGGLQHFSNIISSLLFLLIGLYGLGDALF